MEIVLLTKIVETLTATESAKTSRSRSQPQIQCELGFFLIKFFTHTRLAIPVMKAI